MCKMEPLLLGRFLILDLGGRNIFSRIVSFPARLWQNTTSRVAENNRNLLSHCPQFSSVQSLSRVRLFATPWIAARQASLSITNSGSSLKFMSIESVTPFSHLIFCCPLLLLPPIPPSIRIFSSESTLHMTWPKYWSFSFSIIPSKEIPELISFRMDWLDLGSPCIPRDSQESSPTPQFKSDNSLALSFLYSPTHIHVRLLGKTYAWIYGPLLSK